MFYVNRINRLFEIISMNRNYEIPAPFLVICRYLVFPDHFSKNRTIFLGFFGGSARALVRICKRKFLVQNEVLQKWKIAVLRSDLKTGIFSSK